MLKQLKNTQKVGRRQLGYLGEKKVYNFLVDSGYKVEKLDETIHPGYTMDFLVRKDNYSKPFAYIEAKCKNCRCGDFDTLWLNKTKLEFALKHNDTIPTYVIYFFRRDSSFLGARLDEMTEWSSVYCKKYPPMISLKKNTMRNISSERKLRSLISL